ncbi:hypothetical protein HEQ62_05675 [Haematospirillum jordaniae]|uniref:Uncharacterized protein n=1 Tax=Haematospirillum jordaniae TaxID=1549855 RepID=A0A143DCA1_9PROT|nr:glycosyl hydrolase 108 family protein [Haematospirillum jordaniae]AMW34355.1 hypothetical protein AY555_03190 [Haematospirillum jordaniae]NKD44677.1 hypothetical protein [Haematospirillum jordaniae]NKD57697.1 hypothetical protein [Haematospirillum jordaniae]NKD59267.1 hypothetical protein [Haematospirillum jordaniae]NKD67405.1 hypothetical protein [Haematospirillum jordaniae]
MTASLQSILDAILREEGGFTDNPADRAHYGKADPAQGRRWDCYCTNYGITQATLSDYYKRQATIDDVRNLSESQARTIYQKRYIEDPGFDKVPELIRPVLVDAGVNSGPRCSITWLQDVLNQQGYGPLTSDGILGPATRSAAEKAVSTMGAGLTKALIERRRIFLEHLIATNPSQKRFERGWMARLDRLETETA